MVRDQCRADSSSDDLRLGSWKYLLRHHRDRPPRTGHASRHPVPTGGDEVQLIDGVYCPVRDKANDVGGALCPYCLPGRLRDQCPRPPVNASEHKKQEFIDNCFAVHNFNG